MIAVIDYGMGNLRSVEKAFQHLGFDARICEKPEQAAEASHLVLPGDAAFGDAIGNVRRQGWDECIYRGIEAGKPFLGICVGLQLMFSASEEMGQHQGLDLLPGRVVRFPSTERVPHIGWNQMELRRESPLLKGIPEAQFFYFVHSYYVVPDVETDTLAETQYGLNYTSVAARDGVFGVQFHPEKSQRYGLEMLRNFAQLH
jgi:imidazole glycerol-phosphate synthase subunit HisH